jgi:CHAT domain-containing protein
VKGGKIHGKAIAITRKELLGRIRDFRLLMENYSSPEYLGKELADLLISPMNEALAGADRLAIVPHSSLHFLSFAALPLGDGGFVIDRYPIHYLESATLARYVRTGKAEPLHGEARVLALANPPATKERPALPFTGKEVDVMGRYFTKVSAAEGPNASEALVKSAADAYDVLHIASHGEFLPSAPAESRLLLAATDGQDGNLSVSEIFGMTTRAKLVTLSACETGLGKISAADEIIGMDRAFFYAGANTVVSSLWRISDVASAVTMKRFYRYLSEGKDKAEALRQAQITVRKYFAHPAYWAAFRILGDDR